jgi:hypothetical protein
MNQNPSSESDSSLASQAISCTLCKHEASVLYLKEPATCIYPEPD